MSRRTRILIVEDHEEIAEILGELVESLGHRIALAPTIADAVAAVHGDAPDAILLDVVLPDARETQGLDALRAVAPSIPIVMVTANVDEDLGRELLKRGAFDYIMKPFDRDQLDRALTAALGS
jgi:two-component system, NtrC family, nitrogen regulation response regulator GlnG